ncbi:polysaccharide biosynthesis tyrosine autokinase [Cellulomonas sp. NPDC057328]|uniref:polysaccharide biosynthesis tyrosine autokinase n=1 Tax=Cellulomonas sp. NPDC057328 TaxID=3346101 RepID=UPI003625D0BA
MDLRAYVAILRKRWISIAALTVLGVLGGIGLNAAATPMYTAATQLYVSVQSGGTTSDMLQGANFTRAQVASYARLVTGPLVLGPVIDDLGLDTRADELAERVTADSPLNTSLININVSDESPALAAAIANAVATELTDVVTDLEQPTDGSPSPVKLTVVRDAAAPTDPSSPSTRLNLALGLALGLVAGVAAAVLREMLDTRVRDEDTVAQLAAAPVVGTIAFDEDAGAHPLIVQSDPHSIRAEAFRRLRTNVQFLDVSDRSNSIVVTSSLPAEGKSTTTINLAIALADAGSRVALVDADLRRPTVAKYLGIEGAVGLTTALIGRAPVDQLMQPWGNGMLHVLPSGQVPPNPSELLGSSAMSQLLSKLTAEYDIVLLDTPPLLPVTDAAILARLAGGALVVVGAGKITRHQLAGSLSALKTVDARVLGMVVNREPRKHGERYEYYRYGTETPVAKKTRGRGVLPRKGGSAGEATTAGTASAPVTTATGATALWPGESMTEAALRDRRGLPPQHLRG